MSCPVCEGSSLVPVIDVKDVPVNCLELQPSRSLALDARRADIRLRCCTDCGMIFNASFDPRLVDYTDSYENSLHFSPAFQHYAEGLARHLIDRYRLDGKRVLEIGCGKGEFLVLLADHGRNQAEGFDPTYDGEIDGGPSGVTIVAEHYAGDRSLAGTDLVVCRHVLEHLHDPAALLRQLKAAAGTAPVPIYLEVPDAAYMLAHESFWDVIYEHCNYFAPATLARLLERSGFEVLELASRFEEQFLSAEARPGSPGRTDRTQLDHEVAALVEEAGHFERRYQATVEAWDERLEAWRTQGRRIGLWGAGAKGVSFLNTVERGTGIEAVIDINPRKQGLHVPGTGQQIAPPEVLADPVLDVLLVVNPAYAGEIRARLDTLGSAATIEVV